MRSPRFSEGYFGVIAKIDKSAAGRYDADIIYEDRAALEEVITAANLVDGLIVRDSESRNCCIYLGTFLLRIREKRKNR